MYIFSLTLLQSCGFALLWKLQRKKIKHQR
jgi:hypothetical protein